MGELLGEREASSLLLMLFVHRLCPPRAGQLATGICLRVGDGPTPSPWETHSGTRAPQPNRALPQMLGTLPPLTSEAHAPPA